MTQFSTCFHCSVISSHFWPVSQEVTSFTVSVANVYELFKSTSLRYFRFPHLKMQICKIHTRVDVNLQKYPYCTPALHFGGPHSPTVQLADGGMGDREHKNENLSCRMLKYHYSQYTLQGVEHCDLEKLQKMFWSPWQVRSKKKDKEKQDTKASARYQARPAANTCLYSMHSRGHW